MSKKKSKKTKTAKRSKKSGIGLFMFMIAIMAGVAAASMVAEHSNAAERRGGLKVKTSYSFIGVDYVCETEGLLADIKAAEAAQSADKISLYMAQGCKLSKPRTKVQVLERHEKTVHVRVKEGDLSAGPAASLAARFGSPQPENVQEKDMWADAANIR